jgi:hypothetical protein
MKPIKKIDPLRKTCSQNLSENDNNDLQYLNEKGTGQPGIWFYTEDTIYNVEIDKFVMPIPPNKKENVIGLPKAI